MKRVAKITLSLIVLLAVGAVGLFYVLPALKVGQKLEQTVERSIRDAFGDRIEFSAVQLGLGAVYIHDVRFTSPDSLLQLKIKNVQLSYNLKSLFHSNGDPLKLITEVILNRPVLQYSQRTGAEPSSGSPRISIPDDLAEKMDRLAFLNRLSVSNGEAYWMPRDGEPVRLFQQANGWLQKQDKTRILARFAARLFESEEYNVIVSTAYSLNTHRLDTLRFRIRNYSIVTPVPFLPLGDEINIQKGYVSGLVDIISDSDSQTVSVQGKLELFDGSLRFPAQGLTADQIHLLLSLKNSELMIQNGSSLTVNGTVFHVVGRISRFQQPQIDLRLVAPEFHLDQFTGALKFKPPARIQGRGELRGYLSGSLAQPVFTGSFRSDRIRVGEFDLNQVALTFYFEKDTLFLQNFSAQYYNSYIQGIGQVDVKQKPYRMELAAIASGEFSNALEHAGLPRLASLNGAVVVDISGPVTDPHVTGNLNLSLIREKGHANLLGKFEVHKQNLRLEAGTEDGSFHLKGDVRNFLKAPGLNFQVKNLSHLLNALDIPTLSWLSRRYILDGRIEGKEQRYTLLLKGKSESSGRTRFIMDIDYRIEAHPSMEMHVYLNPEYTRGLVLNFRADFTDSLWTFRNMEKESSVQADVTIDWTRQKKLDGRIKLSGLQIERLLMPGGDRRGRTAGRVFGEIRLSGTVDEPECDLSGWLLDGMLNGEGLFTGEFSGKINKSSFLVNQLLINYRGQPYLQMQGQVQLAPLEVDLSLTGRNVDVNSLIYNVTGYNEILTGTADIDINLKGRKWPLPMYGNIHIRNGKVIWFLFDAINMSFGDRAAGTESGSYLQPNGFYVKHISYTREGNYVLNGDGFFPFNTKDSMDVRLQGYGDFLSMLPDFASVFLETESVGELKLHVKGPYKKLRLYDSRARLLSGRVRLSHIARQIEDISGEAEADGDFIHIKSLRGRIGDAIVSITNYPETPVEAGHLGTPLRIANDWMSLGTLMVTTTENGLPLNIPALMEKGEIGRFWIKGQGDEPGFLIGGPWKHPVFRGEVVLRNVNLMFPFEEDEEEINPIVKNILFNIDWDVVAIAGKDNRYVKKFPSGIDNIYVNIAIDDQISRLHFTGIFRDTTASAAVTQLTLEPGADGAAVENGVPAGALTAVNPDTLPPNTLQFWVGQRKERSADGPDTSTFRIEGIVESSRGNIEYLDLNFRVEKFGAIWDRSELQPIVYGRAWTTVTDSTNFPQNVYLKIYARDPVTGEEHSRGRWEYSYFRLESDLPTYNTTQLHLLATLGYSIDNVKEKVTDMIGISTDNLLFRPILRPLERTLERSLGLDIVRLSSRFTRNFLEMNLVQPVETKLALLRSTKITVGKYLSNRLYFIYTGQVEAWPMNLHFQEPNLALRHRFGLEYRFNPSLLLQMEYDLNNAYQYQREDKKIWIRHSFPIK